MIYFFSDATYVTRSFNSWESAARGFPPSDFWMHALTLFARSPLAFSRPLPSGWQVLQLLSPLPPPRVVSLKSFLPCSALPPFGISFSTEVLPEPALPPQAACAGGGSNPITVAPATSVVILKPARIFLSSFWFILCLLFWVVYCLILPAFLKYPSFYGRLQGFPLKYFCFISFTACFQKQYPVDKADHPSLNTSSGFYATIVIKSG